MNTIINIVLTKRTVVTRVRAIASERSHIFGSVRACSVLAARQWIALTDPLGDVTVWLIREVSVLADACHHDDVHQKEPQ